VALDRKRLIKFLNMTSSQHDAEALIAIRKSNELLRLHELDWTDLIEAQTPPRAAPEPAPEPRDKPEPSARRYNEPNARYAVRKRRRSEEQVRADNFRAAVRAIPFWIRVLFLPAMVGAEFLAYAVLPKRSLVARGLGMVGCLVVVGVVGVPWVMLGVGIFDLSREMLLG